MTLKVRLSSEIVGIGETGEKIIYENQIPSNDRYEWLNSLKIGDEVYYFNILGKRELAKVVNIKNSNPDSKDIIISIQNGDIVYINGGSGYSSSILLKSSYIISL